MNNLESSQLQAAPLMNSEIIKKDQITTSYSNKMYPLDISLSKDYIIFQIQEKYCLYYYQKQLLFQQFLNTHKYFRFFDNLSEIYDDLINSKEDIKVKDVKSNKIKYINLIKEGIRHQLNKNIINTRLIYKYSKDGSKIDIFHQKCDGISNTLVIGESENNRIFGGFTTQEWDNYSEEKKDDYAFLFQLNDMKLYYAIKGKGEIFCRNDFGATFGNHKHFCFCFQDQNDKGRSREDKNNDNIGFDYYGVKNKILERNHSFNLKDYEVFELLLI